MIVRGQIVLTEDTLKGEVLGENRFKARFHNVSSVELAAAEAVVIMIDGRVEVVKAKNGPLLEVQAPTDVRIHAAMNGGFVVGEAPVDPGQKPRIIAACSDLPDLLSAIGMFYTREAVVPGDVGVNADDPDFAEVGEERTVADGAAQVEEDIRHVVRTFDTDGNRTGGAVFYDGEVASAVVKLIRKSGGDATVEMMPSY